jgi:hypothetical protein
MYIPLKIRSLRKVKGEGKKGRRGERAKGRKDERGERGKGDGENEKGDGKNGKGDGKGDGEKEKGDGDNVIRIMNRNEVELDEVNYKKSRTIFCLFFSWLILLFEVL